jgi:lysyl-tRNA synthetase class I
MMVVMQNMFYNIPFPPILKMYIELPMATISKSEGCHVTYSKWTNKQLCAVA